MDAILALVERSSERRKERMKNKNRIKQISGWQADFECRMSSLIPAMTHGHMERRDALSHYDPFFTPLHSDRVSHYKLNTFEIQPVLMDRHAYDHTLTERVSEVLQPQSASFWATCSDGKLNRTRTNNECSEFHCSREYFRNAAIAHAFAAVTLPRKWLSACTTETREGVQSSAGARWVAITTIGGRG